MVNLVSNWKITTLISTFLVWFLHASTQGCLIKSNFWSVLSWILIFTDINLSPTPARYWFTSAESSAMNFMNSYIAYDLDFLCVRAVSPRNCFKNCKCWIYNQGNWGTRNNSWVIWKFLADFLKIDFIGIFEQLWTTYTSV